MTAHADKARRRPAIKTSDKLGWACWLRGPHHRARYGGCRVAAPGVYILLDRAENVAPHSWRGRRGGSSGGHPLLPYPKPGGDLATRRREIGPPAEASHQLAGCGTRQQTPGSPLFPTVPGHRQTCRSTIKTRKRQRQRPSGWPTEPCTCATRASGWRRRAARPMCGVPVAWVCTPTPPPAGRPDASQKPSGGRVLCRGSALWPGGGPHQTPHQALVHQVFTL